MAKPQVWKAATIFMQTHSMEHSPPYLREHITQTNHWLRPPHVLDLLVIQLLWRTNATISYKSPNTRFTVFNPNSGNKNVLN
ncbi:hypothetical protein SESBI_00252 [Sesbania bispinosa]|nr:hypothetical protein SESBI_00252 [Sesbania bispinosa]